jgi:hypothetical protein
LEEAVSGGTLRVDYSRAGHYDLLDNDSE